MRRFTVATPPEDYLGQYGQGWRKGLLVDHVELFRASGGEVREAQAHFGWAVVEGRAWPILCSEIVKVDTEDGPISGRCGEFATPEGCCSRHSY